MEDLRLDVSDLEGLVVLEEVVEYILEFALRDSVSTCPGFLDLGDAVAGADGYFGCMGGC